MGAEADALVVDYESMNRMCQCCLGQEDEEEGRGSEVELAVQTNQCVIYIIVIITDLHFIEGERILFWSKFYCNNIIIRIMIIITLWSSGSVVCT